MNKITPRVRFAPSPTGYLHIGGLRTALYNYLFAKNQNGKLILRIEDTDRKRFVEGAVENLIDTLNWAGISFDEGPEMSGEFAPYLQSERLHIYKELVEKLVLEEKAYYCFCTPERLEQLREEQQKLKLPQSKYDKHCFHLSKSEIAEKLNSNISYVIRLNVQPDKKVIFDDVIRETVEFDTNNVDDQVLLKSDGFPTYHLANVVDDHLMGITHVIRGEEWLSSTPKHIILYEYFGWEKPIFAHLPLLLNPDKSKLSKRQGDVAVEDYREKGYLKEALINFVALLGWNYGDDKEFYEMNELIEKFSLERVHKAGAVFNLEKLNWLNAEHLRNKSNEEILIEFKKIVPTDFKEKDFTDDYLLQIIEAMKPRVYFVKEFISNCSYFYEAPKNYEQKAKEKSWDSETPKLLKELEKVFRDIYKNKNQLKKIHIPILREKEIITSIIENNKDKYISIYNRTLNNKFIPGEWPAFSSFLTKALQIDSKNNLTKEKLKHLASNSIGTELIGYYIEKFENIWNPTKEEYENAMKKYSEKMSISLGKLSGPLRLALSGQSTGPGMFDLLFILGKDEVIKRINTALKNLN